MRPGRGAGVLLLALALAAGGASAAAAFDGERRGFLLGAGMGAGLLGVSGEDLPSHHGLETDLRIGAGLSNRVQLFYSGKQVWVSEDNELVTAGFPSLAVAYYKRPQSPSPYVTGGFGVGLIAAAFRETLGAAVGPAAFVGVGYEFEHHAHLEVHASGGTTLGVSFANIALTLNLTAY